MLARMTQRKPAGKKVAVNARIDVELVAKLDELASKEGTIQYQRSRSELLAFAVREYVDRHLPKSKR